MADRYINPSTGINTGAGTLAAPWKDLEYALEGNRCTEGDTIYLMPGDYSNIFVDKVTASQTVAINMTANAAAVTTIRPYDNNIITIPIATNSTSGGAFLKNEAHNLKIIGVKFSNPNNISSVMWFQRSSTANISVVFEDCYFANWKINALVCNTTTGATARTNSIKLNRCILRNMGNTFCSMQDQTRDTLSLEMYSCDVELAGVQVFVNHYQNCIIKCCNNNFKWLAAIPAIVSCETSNNLIEFCNNKLNRAATTGYKPAIRYKDSVDAFFASNPDKRVVKGNVSWDDWHNTNCPLTANYCSDMGFFWGYYSETNYTMEPIAEYSNMAIPLTDNRSQGWGLPSKRPDKALLLSGGLPVIGGTDFFSPTDVGCYPNTQTRIAKYAKPNTLAFFGDSISEGATNVDWWNNNATNGISAIKYGTDNPAAIGGKGYREMLTLIDWMALRYAPEWAVLCVGVNNLDNAGAGRVPSGLTNQRLADQIIALIRKFDYWGIKPVWLGVHSLKGGSGGATNPQAVNAIVEPICKSNGWIYGNIINYMIAKNASWQTVYYDAYSTDVHPNTLGRQVMAEYALQLVNEARSAGANYGVAKRYITSVGYSRNFH